MDEQAILGAIHTLGPDRLCFGSDMPFRLMHVVLAMYGATLRDFDETDLSTLVVGQIVGRPSKVTPALSLVTIRALIEI